VRAALDRDQPEPPDPDDLRRYRDAGVTRLSVGVQSFDDGLLPGWTG
jgi:coproporphyrinogen III oxidase-like Fe-S oxidoreductase